MSKQTNVGQDEQEIRLNDMCADCDGGGCLGPVPQACRERFEQEENGRG